MQSENEALWKEIRSLRLKHAKQQQIVSKLMEFLLHFVTANSPQSQRQLVEHQGSNEVMTSDLFDPQRTQTSHHTNNSLILRKTGFPPHTLKRKQAALMHSGKQSNKRTTTQQQQHQNFPHLSKLDRHPSVTINELTDNDIGGWLQTTNTLPLVDLVPSPPPSIKHADNAYHQQKSDYGWPTSANESLNTSRQDQNAFAQQNETLQTVGNEDDTVNTYVPDFFLCADDINEKNENIRQTYPAELTNIKRVNMATECYI